jgi:hypothetical protein
MTQHRLLFILSTFMSLYAVFYFKREGYLPGSSRAPTNAQMIDPDKDAFSTAPHDDEYVAVHNTDEHEIHDMGQPANTHADAYDSPTYGGAYVPPTVSDDMGYTGYAGAQGRQSPQVDDNGRVQFPNGRYNEL